MKDIVRSDDILGLLKKENSLHPYQKPSEFYSLLGGKEAMLLHHVKGSQEGAITDTPTFDLELIICPKSSTQQNDKSH